MFFLILKPLVILVILTLSNTLPGALTFYPRPSTFFPLTLDILPLTLDPQQKPTLALFKTICSMKNSGS